MPLAILAAHFLTIGLGGTKMLVFSNFLQIPGGVLNINELVDH